MTMFSLLSEIKQEARDILERRILAGEDSDSDAGRLPLIFMIMNQVSVCASVVLAAAFVGMPGEELEGHILLTWLSNDSESAGQNPRLVRKPVA
jgi:hypothetical protein